MGQQKRIAALLLAGVVFFSTLPMNVLAAEPIDAGGLCHRHPQHTEDCYTLVTSCVHAHTADCYPAGSVSGNMADPSGSTEDEPTECAHVCSEESGCITKVLDCTHEHDESCSDNPSNVIDSAAADVQALIDALPGAEELSGISFEEQQAVYSQIYDAFDAYENLTEEQKEQITGQRFLMLYLRCSTA